MFQPVSSGKANSLVVVQSMKLDGSVGLQSWLESREGGSNAAEGMDSAVRASRQRAKASSVLSSFGLTADAVKLIAKISLHKKKSVKIEDILLYCQLELLGIY